MADAVDRITDELRALSSTSDLTPVGVFARISRIAQLERKLSDAILTRCSLTRDEFLLLALLARKGRPMAPHEITADQLTSAPATTKRLKKLTEDGLVTRECDPEDGRRAIVALTDHGRQIIDPVLRTVLEFECELLGRVDPSLVERLTDDLRMLLTAIEGPVDTSPAAAPATRADDHLASVA